jgi:hypothetical protein
VSNISAKKILPIAKDVGFLWITGVNQTFFVFFGIFLMQDHAEKRELKADQKM